MFYGANSGEGGNATPPTLPPKTTTQYNAIRLKDKIHVWQSMAKPRFARNARAHQDYGRFFLSTIKVIRCSSFFIAAISISMVFIGTAPPFAGASGLIMAPRP